MSTTKFRDLLVTACEDPCSIEELTTLLPVETVGAGRVVAPTLLVGRRQVVGKAGP